MKEAKVGLAEFLDHRIQLSTIVLLILLEADTKFERFTLFTKFLSVPSNIFQGVQWTLPSCILSRQNESGQLRDRCCHNIKHVAGPAPCPRNCHKPYPCLSCHLYSGVLFQNVIQVLIQNFGLHHFCFREVLLFGLLAEVQEICPDVHSPYCCRALLCFQSDPKLFVDSHQSNL